MIVTGALPPVRVTTPAETGSICGATPRSWMNVHVRAVQPATVCVVHGIIGVGPLSRRKLAFADTPNPDGIFGVWLRRTVPLPACTPVPARSTDPVRPDDEQPHASANASTTI